jgi:hypothetical protein
MKTRITNFSSERIFTQALYPLVQLPEGEEQNKNWFQRLFDGF